MKSLSLSLEHCYGIKKLDYLFDFAKKGSVFAIYAPNGVMKTSLAGTFRDLSQGKETSDRVWPKNATKRNILDESGKTVTPSSVFVIEPFNEKYRSDRISTLLVNEKLKAQYEQVHKDIDEKSALLLGDLKTLTGLKSEIDEELSQAFTHNRKDFFKALVRIKSEVLDDEHNTFSEIRLIDIFNSKVDAVLTDPSFRDNIKEYTEKYDALLRSSTFFKKGVFTHNNAADIAKNLKTNGFFGAKHSVYVRIKGEKREIETVKELEAAIQEEKDLILTDDSLKQSFEAMNAKLLKNAELRTFFKCLEDHPFLIPEISNPEGLRQKLWISYLKTKKDNYLSLLEAFNRGKQEIADIVSQAKDQNTRWSEVINIFNERFSVPFVVRMDNQEDVILKSETPTICFDFLEDPENKSSAVVPVEESKLQQILSNGEKRALYILNIIFEVEARRSNLHETLFVVDDIADSFDYKNKYAIIEYLKDVSEDPKFKQIILSHNFDFYRTVSKRLGLPRDRKLLACKTPSGISLQEEKHQNHSPFTNWKTALSERKILISLVPFLRNLAEFSGNEFSYLKLTSLLHFKSDTKKLVLLDLEKLIKGILHDQGSLTLTPADEGILEIIYSEAEMISKDSSETPLLEEKVVLSIAIRIKAEEFMVRKINDDTFWNSIDSNQTIKLIKRFRSDFPLEKESIRILEQVNLMTPESIHLNAFMYEPILDLSAHHLKRLYSKVSAL